jgi:hypothetical protein
MSTRVIVASHCFAVAAEAVVLGVLDNAGPDGIEVDVGAQHRQRRTVAFDQQVDLFLALCPLGLGLVA